MLSQLNGNPTKRKEGRKKKHWKSKGGGSYNSTGLQSSFALSLLFARLVGSPALYLSMFLSLSMS